MTREEYKTQRLGAKIGELTTNILDLEFAVQYLSEENSKLKTEIERLNAALEPKKVDDVESK